ncbi:MAG: hypothetical protein AB1742_01355 [bacterium]
MNEKIRSGIRKRIAGIVLENKSQNNLSRLIGFEQRKISNYLRTGNPSVEFLIRLYRSLGVSPLWVLEGAGPKFAKDAGTARGRGAFTYDISRCDRPDRIMKVAEAAEKRYAGQIASDSVRKLNLIVEAVEKDPSLIPVVKTLLNRLAKEKKRPG